MKIRRLIAICAILSLGFFGAIILAQERVPAGDTLDYISHARFDAGDREIAGEWYKGRQGNLPEGFREKDRLAPDSEMRLRVGEVLDPDLRGKIQPVPNDLLQKLPPPAHNSRYVILDGHLLLVDEETWNVSDVLHFELDFGRP